ncbi:MAG: T9SS type A sorting domain-containing protein [Flavobacteriales bacterium]
MNDLSTLPELPSTLEWLDCDNNSISLLPELPDSLAYFKCGDNQLRCLPTLPMLITDPTYFNISGNPFTCLPNFTPAMTGANAQWLLYPLCDLTDLDNNPYGCRSLEGIAGTVFHDTNTDCMKEVGEPRLINIPLKLLNDQGEQVALTTPFGNGIYNFVAGVGEYTVELDTEDRPYQASCTSPGDVQNVVLTSDDPSALNVDFGVDCPGIDVGVRSIVNTGWVFPGQVHNLRVSVGDMSAWYGLQCAAGLSGIVTVRVDGPVFYLGPGPGSPSPTLTGPLEFTYTIADFAGDDVTEDLDLLFATLTTAIFDDEVCVEVLVEPMATDLNPANNTYSQCYLVLNSYDPNVKVVWPGDVAPEFNDYFTYTIYFQNIGSAPAFNIRIADTLDSNLDMGSFSVINYSHTVQTYLHGNELTFRFNNIMLPDSTSDPEGSIGYVQYRIKALPGLPAGTVIENTAHIYFDFNEAIVTNTTENHYVIDTGVGEASILDLTAFPNPGSGIYQVTLGTSVTGPTLLNVYDVSGKRVAEHRINGPRMMLDLSDQPEGLYLLRVRNARVSEVLKLVKQ